MTEVHVFVVKCTCCSFTESGYSCIPALNSRSSRPAWVVRLAFKKETENQENKTKISQHYLSWLRFGFAMTEAAASRDRHHTTWYGLALWGPPPPHHAPRLPSWCLSDTLSVSVTSQRLVSITTPLCPPSCDITSVWLLSRHI